MTEAEARRAFLALSPPKPRGRPETTYIVALAAEKRRKSRLQKRALRQAIVEFLLTQPKQRCHIHVIDEKFGRAKGRCAVAKLHTAGWCERLVDPKEYAAIRAERRATAAMLAA